MGLFFKFIFPHIFFVDEDLLSMDQHIRNIEIGKATAADSIAPTTHKKVTCWPFPYTFYKLICAFVPSILCFLHITKATVEMWASTPLKPHLRMLLGI